MARRDGSAGQCLGLCRLILTDVRPYSRAEGPLDANILIAAVPMVFTTAHGMTHDYGTAEKLGEVNFATSCNKAAQSNFDRAVALLHSFRFSRAIEGFNAVLREDLRAQSRIGELH
jgi:hypothetical protein